MTTTVATPPDAADPHSPSARRAGWFGWWFYVLVMVIAPFALVLAAGVAFYLWWKLTDAKAAHEVGLEVARVQSLGEPVTIYDLYQYHRVPTGTPDNTAQWVAALKHYDGKQYGLDCRPLPIVGNGERDALDAGVPNEQVLAAEAFLKKHDAIVQATLAAAKTPGECRLPTAFELGIAAMAPHMQQARALARTMSVRMRVSIARGDTESAVESVAASLAAARTLDHQLTLVEQLVRIAIMGVAQGDIEFLLNHAELTDEQLARLQSQVAGLEIQNSLTTSLVGERGMGFHSFHQFPAAPTPPVATVAQPMAGGELTRPAACKFYLQTIQEIIDASRQPFPKSLSDSQQVAARVNAQAQTSNPLARMNYAVSMQILPAMEATFGASARAQAIRDLTLMALAAERYRLAHGEYPPDTAALAQFLPAVPLDPYDGQPLRMKLAGGGLVLYSVGQDGIDNGGEDPEDRNLPDIVVRLTTPASAKP